MSKEGETASHSMGPPWAVFFVRRAPISTFMCLQYELSCMSDDGKFFNAHEL